jgi:uncharacterized protein (DUF924 family)
MPPLASPADVVRFWSRAGYERWFGKDPAFDRTFKHGFLDAHVAAAAGALEAWRRTPIGALALMLLLDQFPRNAFRDTPRMFATDAAALRLADRALAASLDREMPAPLRSFFYLPYMHSESLADQDRSVALADAASRPWAVMHRDLIARFGRFPHRNPILGRPSTAAERDYLASGGFRG